MRKNNLLFLLLALILATGCVYEDLSDCIEDFHLSFLYDMNGDGTDDFGKEVKGMVVYVFDQQTGLLADIVEVSPEDLSKGYFNPNLPDGKYTFIAWASSGSNLNNGGFSTGQAGSTPGSYTPPTIGTTLIDDFRLYLNTTTPAGGMPTPTIEQFDNLYYAVARDVQIKNGRPTAPAKLDFTKNSTILDVNITGLENIPNNSSGTPPVVYVTGTNAVLTQNDTTDPNAQQVRYNSYQQTPGVNSVQDMIKTLKLDINQPTAQQPLLHITDPNTGKDLVPPIPVVDAIKKMQNADGTPLIRNQRDLDNWPEFPLDVHIERGDNGEVIVTVRVVVGGFRPQPLDPTPVARP
jgi:hypothetical protein